MTARLPVLLVTGLAAEARIAAGGGVAVVAGGGDPERLARLLRAALARGARAVISFGIAGGLAPGLAPGRVLVARAIHDGQDLIPTDAVWADRIAALVPDARPAELAGVGDPVATVAGKAALRARTGACAVDMESHIAARLTALAGLPFAALRVVADPAERALPPAALVGMRPDGTADVAAVLRSLVRAPHQVPALVRTALDTRAAFAALRLSRSRLTPLIGRAEADGTIPPAFPHSAAGPARSSAL